MDGRALALLNRRGPAQNHRVEVAQRLEMPMLYLLIKAIISAVVIVVASELAKRSPGLGALIASLPLVSVFGMIWLWRDTHSSARLSAHAGATFWYVLPSLPMFLLIPAMLDRGMPFWLALAAGCTLTIILYVAMIAVGPRFGLPI